MTTLEPLRRKMPSSRMAFLASRYWMQRNTTAGNNTKTTTNTKKQTTTTSGAPNTWRVCWAKAFWIVGPEGLLLSPTRASWLLLVVLVLGLLLLLFRLR